MREHYDGKIVDFLKISIADDKPDKESTFVLVPVVRVDLQFASDEISE
jgi:hypothetical protein